MDLGLFVSFLNQKLFAEPGCKVSEDELVGILEDNRLQNLQALVLGSRVKIQRLRGLGSDVIIPELLDHDARDIELALTGGLLGFYIYWLC